MKKKLCLVGVGLTFTLGLTACGGAGSAELTPTATPVGKSEVETLASATDQEKLAWAETLAADVYQLSEPAESAEYVVTSPENFCSVIESASDTDQATGDAMAGHLNQYMSVDKATGADMMFTYDVAAAIDCTDHADTMRDVAVQFGFDR
ncbi:hypothetical protein AB0K08_05965 [Citricoccus sp. NPDC055426]|uniref:hypothetical protein n=1 Tax=Citricoccus sp. NPDC055426 TaxID=3155536 RepID=UPI003432907F